jgi:4-hydroxybenzoyl-CoA thioesterase
MTPPPDAAGSSAAAPHPAGAGCIGDAPPGPPPDSPALYAVAVEFGDCDPAGIVYFPNFFRWMDAASRHFFIHRGVPPWRDTERDWGVLGTPLVDVQARFIAPASYGDRLRIDTAVTEWRRKSFVQRHRIWRGGQLLVEGTEVRVFAARAVDGSAGIRAVPIPPQVRALCTG